MVATCNGSAATTILSGTTNSSAWGANIGWLDAYADNTNGAVIGEFFCSGSIYSANCGWINLGSGAPLNGIGYQNNSAVDFGINHDGTGNLRGYAYGANIGWLNFETNGAPKVDLRTGALSGYVWSPNVGWISLSNTMAVVRTGQIAPAPDIDGDGIADAWEYTYAGNLTKLGGRTSDYDGDGLSDYQEYIADTNPIDPDSGLRITAYSMFFSGSSDIHTLTWTSRPTRLYRFISSTDLNYGFSPMSVLINPDPGTNTTSGIGFGGPVPNRFLGIEAVRPLVP